MRLCQILLIVIEDKDGKANYLAEVCFMAALANNGLLDTLS